MAATIDFATQITTWVRRMDQNYLLNAERMEKRIKYCLCAAAYSYFVQEKKGPWALEWPTFNNILAFPSVNSPKSISGLNETTNAGLIQTVTSNG